MNVLLLKLAYAIEIGAYLAYVGHFKVSKDVQVRRIAHEELRHMITLRAILYSYNSKPSVVLNAIFFVVGTCIKFTCYITPMSLLNMVACLMEKINIFNYRYMAKRFPERFENMFVGMQKNEEEHERYFRS